MQAFLICIFKKLKELKVSDGSDGSDGSDRGYGYGNGPPETKAGYVQVDGPGEGLGGPGDQSVAIGDTGEDSTTMAGSDNDDTLPKTATSTFDWMLGGLIAMMAGLAGLFTRRKKKDETK